MDISSNYKNLIDVSGNIFKAAVEEIDPANNIFASKTVLVAGSKLAACEITRPENTTQYSPGDCVASASPSSSTQCIEISRINGGSGKIVGITAKTNNKNWVEGLRIVFYSSPPQAFTNDNLPWPGTKYADSVIGRIDIPYFEADGDSSGAGSFGFGIPDFPLLFECASDSRKIYFQMFLFPYEGVSPVPISGQKFSVTIHIKQD